MEKFILEISESSSKYVKWIELSGITRSFDRVSFNFGREFILVYHEDIVVVIAWSNFIVEFVSFIDFHLHIYLHSPNSIVKIILLINVFSFLIFIFFNFIIRFAFINVINENNHFNVFVFLDSINFFNNINFDIFFSSSLFTPYAYAINSFSSIMWRYFDNNSCYFLFFSFLHILVNIYIFFIYIYIIIKYCL